MEELINKLSEEEKKAIDILKNSIADYVIGEYCEKCADYNICVNLDEDCYFTQAIDKVVNLIEKQQEQLQEKDKIINDMAKKINEAYFEDNDFALWYEKYICEVQEKEDYSYLEPIIIEYFTKKAREV